MKDSAPPLLALLLLSLAAPAKAATVPKRVTTAAPVQPVEAAPALYTPAQTAERQAAARKAGLPDTATWDEINLAPQEDARKEAALKLGLPISATWTDIRGAQRRADHKAVTAQLGLPESASDDQVQKALNEARRKPAALSLGLPESASWDEINREAQRRSKSSAPPR